MMLTKVLMSSLYNIFLNENMKEIIFWFKKSKFVILWFNTSHINLIYFGKFYHKCKALKSCCKKLNFFENRNSGNTAYNRRNNLNSCWHSSFYTQNIHTPNPPALIRCCNRNDLIRLHQTNKCTKQRTISKAGTQLHRSCCRLGANSQTHVLSMGNKIQVFTFDVLLNMCRCARGCV